MVTFFFCIAMIEFPLLTGSIINSDSDVCSRKRHRRDHAALNHRIRLTTEDTENGA